MSCQLSNLKQKIKKIFAAGVDVGIVPWFLELITFF